MPNKYAVHTQNVTEVIEADSPEAAAALSSYAGVSSLVLSVELLEVDSPVDTVIPSAGAPEASEQALTQTVTLSGPTSPDVAAS